MTSFFDLHGVISKYHHGGRKGHGTVSALSMILDFLQIQKEEDKVTTTLLTDLSVCYDTIEHKILLLKMDHYGIRGVPLKIVENILSNRSQYVEIDTFSSSLKPSLPCSVCQGSIISSLLYVTFCNEIPLLGNLIENQIYDNITNFRFVSFDRVDFSEVSHLTISYIDDSTVCISSKDVIILQKYLQRFYNLLHYFYICNKLCLNEDKTKLLVTSKNYLQQSSKSIDLNAGIYNIKQSKKVKILGYWLDTNLNHDSYLNKIISKINYRLLLSKKVTCFMSSRAKVLVYKSLLISILTYVMPLIIDLNSRQLNTINTMVTKIARICLGFKSYKWNNTTVLRKCGWLGGTHLIYFSTLCFIHKINFDMQPISLVEKFIYRENRGSRYTRCPFKTKYDPKSKITKEGLFSKGLLFYKKIPDIFKTYNMSKFKKEIKSYIKENLPPDRIKKHVDYD